MRIGNKLRDTKELLAVHMDIWAFEKKGRVYLQTLARDQGTLFWTITAAKGTLDKPERGLCLASGFAENSTHEPAILGGPESLIKALKSGAIRAFDHVDTKAKEQRAKEFAVLIKDD